MMKARTHLKNLGIESMTSRTNLRDLARGIRNLLSAPFEDVKKYYAANVASSRFVGDADLPSSDSES